MWKRFQSKQELKLTVQGVVSPADPGLAPEVLQAQLEDADTKLVICCSATLGKVRRARELAATTEEERLTRRRERVKWYTLMVYEDADATLLRLFECFMESAPQLVLQIYILLK